MTSQNQENQTPPSERKEQSPSASPAARSRCLGCSTVLIAAVSLVIFAATFNPSQEQHLRAIDAIAVLKQYEPDSAVVYALNQSCDYHDYIFFSTATLGGNKALHGTYFASYGFLGHVKTTQNISSAVSDIDELVKALKRTH